MSSIRPYTRKRAVLISYKIFLRYPEALRPAFPRLKEKLEDPDPGRSFNVVLFFLSWIIFFSRNQNKSLKSLTTNQIRKFFSAYFGH